MRFALRGIAASSEITIRLNPKDVDIISTHKPELLRSVDGIKGINLEQDERISRGGCVVDSNYGEVDATIDSLMKDIEDRLRSAS